MAHPTLTLVHALRRAAKKITTGDRYQWSHYGVCNCGQLAQVLTDQSADQIREALFAQQGDWGQGAREYCPGSGLPMDVVLDTMTASGLEPQDIAHLERLTDPVVLRALSERAGERVTLRYSNADDVVLYMTTWADILEAKLPAEPTRIHRASAVDTEKKSNAA